jgi:hypothetical protein
MPAPLYPYEVLVTAAGVDLLGAPVPLDPAGALSWAAAPPGLVTLVAVPGRSDQIRARALAPGVATVTASGVAPDGTPIADAAVLTVVGPAPGGGGGGVTLGDFSGTDFGSTDFT